ncbi:MAG: hypothetical protein WD029_06955 [Microthrixaceae bacterium]
MADRSTSLIALLERRADRERQRRQAAERAAERGLRRLYEVNQRLDELVAERTAEALASRMEVLQIVSQDILTPLLHLEGLLERVDTSPLPELDQRRVAESALAADRCVQLVGALVDLLTMNTGAARQAVEVANLLLAINEVIADRQSLATEQGCSLVLEASFDDVMEVVLDLPRTVRILDELIAGSVQLAKSQVRVKATFESVRIPVEEGDAELLELVVAVTHDGDATTVDSLSVESLVADGLGSTGNRGETAGFLLVTQLSVALGGSLLLQSVEGGGEERVLRLPLTLTESEHSGLSPEP